MSERYSITASLWVNYDKNIVNFILKKGIELGFTYEIEDYATYEVIDQHKLLRKEAIVSLEEAFNYVLTAELPFLWINFKETKFDLGIQNINQTIYISFTGFGEGWKKKYLHEEEPDFDLHRYAKLLLDLISDFKIYEFKIETY